MEIPIKVVREYIERPLDNKTSVTGFQNSMGDTSFAVCMDILGTRFVYVRVSQAPFGEQGYSLLHLRRNTQYILTIKRRSLNRNNKKRKRKDLLFVRIARYVF
jgi:hypothetical protein